MTSLAAAPLDFIADSNIADSNTPSAKILAQDPEKKAWYKRMLTSEFAKSAAIGAGVTTVLKLGVSLTGAGAVVTGITVATGKTLIIDVGGDVLKARKENDLTTAQALKKIFVTDVRNAYTAEARAQKYAETLARLQEAAEKRAEKKGIELREDGFANRYRNARASMSTIFNDQVAPYKYTKKLGINLAGAVGGAYLAHTLTENMPAISGFFARARDFVAPYIKPITDGAIGRFFSKATELVGKGMSTVAKNAGPLLSSIGSKLQNAGSLLSKGASAAAGVFVSTAHAAPLENASGTDTLAGGAQADGLQTAETPAADAAPAADATPVAPVEAAAPAPQYTEYKVQPRDTLTRIAYRNNMSLARLLEANPALQENPGRIIAGKTIVKIPVIEVAAAPAPVAVPDVAVPVRPTEYKVVYGDTLGKLATRFGVSTQQLAEANGITNVNRIIEGRTIKIPALDAATAAVAPEVGSTATAPVVARPTLRVIDNCSFSANNETFQRVACGNDNVTQIQPGERLSFTVYGPNGSVETVTRTFNASAPEAVAKSEFINGVMPAVLNDLEKRGFMNARNLNVIARTDAGSPAVGMP